nr:MAG TPA: hypothetical protein [Caudoviricetes sp.]
MGFDPMGKLTPCEFAICLACVFSHILSFEVLNVLPGRWPSTRTKGDPWVIRG